MFDVPQPEIAILFVLSLQNEEVSVVKMRLNDFLKLEAVRLFSNKGMLFFVVSMIARFCCLIRDKSPYVTL